MCAQPVMAAESTESTDIGVQFQGTRAETASDEVK